MYALIIYMFIPACPHRESQDCGKPDYNKDIFMCILRFHASAGYLQHYETQLKELNLHPDGDASKEAPLDQYDVK